MIRPVVDPPTRLAGTPPCSCPGALWDSIEPPPPICQRHGRPAKSVRQLLEPPVANERLTDPVGYSRRCLALVARGLDHDIAEMVWWLGNSALIADLERASDEQLRQVKLEKIQHDATTSLTALSPSLPGIASECQGTLS